MAKTTTFVPTLIINCGVSDISFYTNAFGAKELRRWANANGTIHVAEMEIDGAMFHLHEEVQAKGDLSPFNAGGRTVTIGLMVSDVAAVFGQAIAAGAKVISPVKDYDYGYRQATIADPFGHHWLIQKQLNEEKK